MVHTRLTRGVNFSLNYFSRLSECPSTTIQDPWSLSILLEIPKSVRILLEMVQQFANSSKLKFHKLSRLEQNPQKKPQKAKTKKSRYS